MRPIFIPATLAALVVAVPLAFAAEQQTSGVVRSFNAHKMTLTLKDGSRYQLPKGFKNPGLKAGQNVTITWENKHGKHQASAVKIGETGKM